MKFNRNEKVLISPRHTYGGERAEIVSILNYNSSKPMYSVKREGSNSKIHLSEKYIRKIKYNTSLIKPRKGQLVRIVDIKGSYNKAPCIGYVGYIRETDGRTAVISRNDGNDFCVQMGDFELVPQNKRAYVLSPFGINNKELSLKEIVMGECIWTDGMTEYYDSIVFDDFSEALDTFMYKSGDYDLEDEKMEIPLHVEN